ncbi:Translation initiation factor 2 (IF-2, GTPase) [Rubellimicrobium mesophilum DSM 19309]|uniref:Translation initiation factor 2 (IF-2, GTPase) n=1 Tax=Rubellimicrobium mesophilum DSM 19309 TaxID=442562 RepID=A0A017HVB0_9RHOB|nr:hypothetical protein [Rubellimicrobium mesophilum]EYD77689.1 Translation initiation factor 2 (IF-2, GTPase) [Rubellimicrobium mesophilum DSM 19309]
MADTWDLPEPFRPHARPDDLVPEPLRPHERPTDLGMEDHGAVPSAVQADATLPEAIPLDRTALIGLFHGPDGSSALLRLPSGSVVKVAAGESVDGGRVTAIGQEGLRLQKDGREIVLTMPS